MPKVKPYDEKNYSLAQIDDFVKAVNRLRKESKGEWYAYEAVVANMTVKINGYGTWLRTFKVNGLDYSNCMDRKASEFLADLREPFRRLAVG